ncbi:hypothetical protein BDI4_870049 [Burkholderia diffusa]|nr:hypothetical protein BDI4_870049 [Burkholderia diffusa]
MRFAAKWPGVADGTRQATIGGITHGMPLATWDAPASGRPDATKMGGDAFVNKQSGKQR